LSLVPRAARTTCVIARCSTARARPSAAVCWLVSSRSMTAGCSWISRIHHAVARHVEICSGFAPGQLTVRVKTQIDR
jgi:hypothetical protein